MFLRKLYHIWFTQRELSKILVLLVLHVQTSILNRDESFAFDYCDTYVDSFGGRWSLSRQHQSWMQEQIVPAWRELDQRDPIDAARKQSQTSAHVVTRLICCSRHDEGAEESDGVAGGTIAAKPGHKEPLHHLGCGGVHVAQLSQVAGSHDEDQHGYQQFKFPNLQYDVVSTWTFFRSCISFNSIELRES